MSAPTEGKREGSLEAPTRHPVPWRDPEFYNEDSLFAELERVYDICHGCRRCFNLCESFPTLFDAIDESDSMELDGVAKEVYWQVVDHCYLCDMCYMSKCPYVPPHEWNIDFPHLMLRAKAVKFKNDDVKGRDKLITSTDTIGRLASIPVVNSIVNAANGNPAFRSFLDANMGIHPDALLPSYHSDTLNKRMAKRTQAQPVKAVAGSGTTGKVVLFGTCYGNYNEPQLGEDLIKVFEHTGIAVRLAEGVRCCGMPKLELGDLKAVEQAKQVNINRLAAYVDAGWDIVAPVPSCVLMFKQELPLLFPDEALVARVGAAFFDPFEYLMLRHKDDLLNTDFTRPLGKIAYQVACHQRVQNVGMKTRDLLNLVPDTTVEAIERCSGHDGTYTYKSEFHDSAMKILKPVVNRVKMSGADYYTSDCAMAGHHIENGLDNGSHPTHPLTLLRMAYGI